MTIRYLDLPIGLIDCEAQVRAQFPTEELEALAATIRVRGVLQPIRVAANAERYRLIAGERRLRAAHIAGLSMVPAVVVPAGNDPSQLLEDQLLENVQRSDLAPMDLARGIDRLMTLRRVSAREAANSLGLSEATVAKALALLALPQELQQQVGGKISLSAGYELSKIGDSNEQAAAAALVMHGTLTRDQLISRRKSPATHDTQNTALAKRAVATLAPGKAITLVATDLTLESSITMLEELLARFRKSRNQGLTLSTAIRLLRETSAVRS